MTPRPGAARPGLASGLRRAAGLLDRLLPPACAVCRATVPPGPPLCAVCESGLPFVPRPHCPRCGAPSTSPLDDLSCAACDPWPGTLARAASAVLHRPPADELVAGLKYRGWTALAPRLAELMVEPAGRLVAPARTVVAEPPPATEPSLGGASPLGAEPILAAVPLDPRRRRRRGFNQSELLADGLAVRTGWPRLREGLVRRRTRRHQAELGRGERLSNVLAAFAWESGVHPSAKPVLLVDDVLTTGATAAACSAAIEGAGGRCLGVVTFARSLPAPDAE